MPKNKKILKAFKGAQADTAKGKAMSPGTSATGGTRGQGSGPSKIGPPVKDVPFKKPLGPIQSALFSAAVPMLGPAINFAAKKRYEGRQKFAKKQGLYRDTYKTTGKVLQPNSPKGKKYLKDAGFDKRPPGNPERGGPDSTNKLLKPVQASAVNEPLSTYKMPTVNDGVFNYTVGLKTGGLLIQGIPKLTKKGWK